MAAIDGRLNPSRRNRQQDKKRSKWIGKSGLADKHYSEPCTSRVRPSRAIDPAKRTRRIGWPAECHDRDWSDRPIHKYISTLSFNSAHSLTHTQTLCELAEFMKFDHFNWKVMKSCTFRQMFARLIPPCNRNTWPDLRFLVGPLTFCIEIPYLMSSNFWVKLKRYCGQDQLVEQYSTSFFVEGCYYESFDRLHTHNNTHTLLWAMIIMKTEKQYPETSPYTAEWNDMRFISFRWHHHLHPPNKVRPRNIRVARKENAGKTYERRQWKLLLCRMR